jgi:hypothetical protein
MTDAKPFNPTQTPIARGSNKSMTLEIPFDPYPKTYRETTTNETKEQRKKQK